MGCRVNCYLHAAHKVFTGKNLSCVDESTGQAVISYKTSLLPATQVGQMVITSKVGFYWALQTACWIILAEPAHVYATPWQAATHT